VPETRLGCLSMRSWLNKEQGIRIRVMNKKKPDSKEPAFLYYLIRIT